LGYNLSIDPLSPFSRPGHAVDAANLKRIQRKKIIPRCELSLFCA